MKPEEKLRAHKRREWALRKVQELHRRQVRYEKVKAARKEAAREESDKKIKVLEEKLKEEIRVTDKLVSIHYQHISQELGCRAAKNADHVLKSVLKVGEMCYENRNHLVWAERLYEKGISVACSAVQRWYLDMDRVEEINPTGMRKVLGLLLWHRSYVRERMGKYEAAIEDADDAIFVLPRDMKWKAYRHRALACNALGKATEALASYYNALALPGCTEVCKLELEQTKTNLFSRIAIVLPVDNLIGDPTCREPVVREAEMDKWEEFNDLMRGKQSYLVSPQTKKIWKQRSPFYFHRGVRGGETPVLLKDEFFKLLDDVNRDGDIWQDSIWETPAPSIWQRSYWSIDPKDIPLDRLEPWKHRAEYSYLWDVSTLDPDGWTEEKMKRRNERFSLGEEYRQPMYRQSFEFQRRMWHDEFIRRGAKDRDMPIILKN